MVLKFCWIILALIHVLPALALFLPRLITKLYGITGDSSTFLLLHHRAALFFAIFVICLWAAFDPGSRRLSVVAVAISMLSFLVMYWLAGAPASLKSIAIADIAGLPFLAYVGWSAFQQNIQAAADI
jgi:hypothetical protein